MIPCRGGGGSDGMTIGGDHERPSGVYHVVPRFYFNVRCDRFEATDIVGEHCRDRGAAHAEALRAARAIVRKQLASDDLPRLGWIEVEDEQHRSVLKVPLRSAAY